MLQSVDADIRARTLVSSGAALLVGAPIFFAGVWVMDRMLPPGVPRGLAIFTLLGATVGLMGLTRRWASDALARRGARPSV